MKTVHVTEAVGMVLGQDLTRILPGVFKGAAFKKGHIIRQQDIPMMLSMGKDHVYILEFGPNDVHENEAAKILAESAAGPNLYFDEASEGKVNIRAGAFGLLKIDIDALMQINSIEGLALSTVHNDIVVQKGQLVASAKIVPLILPKAAIEEVRKLASGTDVIKVLPLPARKVGLVITGNEVYYERIEDRFQSIIEKKVTALGSELTQSILVPDDAGRITSAIKELAAKNDVVFVTGGMSVDPDDVTPLAVRETGANVIVYGTPVLPGAMFLVAYLKETPILGIPACGMFNRITALDVILPKVLIGEVITRQYIASLGHGGLCQNCAEGCRFPNCAFCK